MHSAYDTTKDEHYNLYVRNTLGKYLRECLKDVVQVRPTDPIEFISQWLYKAYDSTFYMREREKYLKDVGRTYRQLRNEEHQHRERIRPLIQAIHDEHAKLRLARKDERDALHDFVNNSVGISVPPEVKQRLEMVQKIIDSTGPLPQLPPSFQQAKDVKGSEDAIVNVFAEFDDGISPSDNEWFEDSSAVDDQARRASRNRRDSRRKVSNDDRALPPSSGRLTRKSFSGSKEYRCAPGSGQESFHGRRRRRVGPWKWTDDINDVVVMAEATLRRRRRQFGVRFFERDGHRESIPEKFALSQPGKKVSSTSQSGKSVSAGDLEPVRYHCQRHDKGEQSRQKTSVIDSRSAIERGADDELGVRSAANDDNDSQTSDFSVDRTGDVTTSTAHSGQEHTVSENSRGHSGVTKPVSNLKSVLVKRVRKTDPWPSNFACRQTTRGTFQECSPGPTAKRVNFDDNTKQPISDEEAGLCPPKSRIFEDKNRESEHVCKPRGHPLRLTPDSSPPDLGAERAALDLNDPHFGNSIVSSRAHVSDDQISFKDKLTSLPRKGEDDLASDVSDDSTQRVIEGTLGGRKGEGPGLGEPSFQRKSRIWYLTQPQDISGICMPAQTVPAFHSDIRSEPRVVRIDDVDISRAECDDSDEDDDDIEESDIYSDGLAFDEYEDDFNDGDDDGNDNRSENVVDDEEEDSGDFDDGEHDNMDDSGEEVTSQRDQRDSFFRLYLHQAGDFSLPPLAARQDSLARAAVISQRYERQDVSLPSIRRNEPISLVPRPPLRTVQMTSAGNVCFVSDALGVIAPITTRRRTLHAIDNPDNWASRNFLCQTHYDHELYSQSDTLEEDDTRFQHMPIMTVEEFLAPVNRIYPFCPRRYQ